MKELHIEALTENLTKVLEFIDSELENNDCNMKSQMQIDIAVEELFVNVASYSYEGSTGMADITLDIDSDRRARITISDSGIPYDPLKKDDPDVTLSAEERSIGGLGIYMVKKSMDDFTYEYKDGKNVVTITKAI